MVGAALEVLNVLGHGLNEKPYENALVVHFGLWTRPMIRVDSCPFGVSL